jgi:hypothetical protein
MTDAAGAEEGAEEPVPAPPVGLGAVDMSQMSDEAKVAHTQQMMMEIGLVPDPESPATGTLLRGVFKPIVNAVTYGVGAIADIRDFYRAGRDGFFEWATGLEAMDHGVNPDGTKRTEAEAARAGDDPSVWDQFATSKQYQSAIRKTTGMSEEAPIGDNEESLAVFSSALGAGMTSGVFGAAGKATKAMTGFRTAEGAVAGKKAYNIFMDNAKMGGWGGGLAVAAERWDPTNPVLQMVGEVVGGTGYALYKNLKEMPEAVLHEKLARLPPFAYEEAHKMLADAERFGVKVLGIEALDDPQLLDLAGDVSRANPIIPMALRGRDQNLVDMVNDEMLKKLEFNQMRPRDLNGNPTTGHNRGPGLNEGPDIDDFDAVATGENVISAASQLLAKARKTAQDVVDPMYKLVTTKNHNIPKKVMVQLMKENPELRDVYSRLRNTKMLKRGFMHEDGTKASFNNMKSIDALMKQLGQEITAHMEKATGSPLNGTIAGYLITAKGNLRNVIDKYHPGYGDAMDEFKKQMDLHHTPLAQGEIGRIAKQERFAHVVETVTNWENINPKLLGKVMDRLAMENPRIPAAITKHRIKKALNEATDGERLDTPHKKTSKRFIKSLVGNQAKSKQLQALVHSIERANGYKTDGLFGGVRRVFQILDKVDNIPARANAGARRDVINSTLNPGAKVVDETINVAQGSFLITLNRKIKEIINKRGYERMAETMTDPDNLEKLREIGKLPPTSVKARALLVNLFNISRTYQEEIQQ